MLKLNVVNKINKIDYADNVDFDKNNYIKNYPAPYNNENSCFFHVATRLFVCEPILSDALERWNKENDSIECFGTEEEVKLSIERKESEEIFWARFFRTLQKLNCKNDKKLSRKQVDLIFKPLYKAFRKKFNEEEAGKQQDCNEALNFIKEKFEKHLLNKVKCMGQNNEIIYKDQTLYTELTKKSCFSFDLDNQNKFCLRKSHDRVIEGSFLSGDTDSQKESIEVYVDESNSYLAIYMQKRYSDVFATQKFMPKFITKNNKICTQKKQVDIGSKKVFTDEIDIEDIKDIKLNDDKYKLAFYGVHSGWATSGHYFFENFEREKIQRFNDSNTKDNGNKKEQKTTYRGGCSIYPAFYIKEKVAKKISPFIEGKNYSSKFHKTDYVYNKVNDDEGIKQQIIDLATTIENQKIIILKDIVKEIIKRNLFENEEAKTDFEFKMKEFTNDNEPKITSDSLLEGEGFFSLINRTKICEARDEIQNILINYLLQQDNNNLNFDKNIVANTITKSLNDIIKRSFSSGEDINEAVEEFKDLKEKIFSYFPLSLNQDNLNTNININNNINQQNSNNQITAVPALGSVGSSSVYSLPTSTSNDPHGSSFSPGGSGNSGQSKSQTTPDRRSNSGIIIKKKSTDDDKKEKDNERNTSGNEGDKNKKTNNNSSLMIMNDENKTSKPPEITIIDILLCLLIIGIFIIIYKLIEQNKYNKIKSGGGSGGGINYNLKDTHEERKKIDYF